MQDERSEEGGGLGEGGAGLCGALRLRKARLQRDWSCFQGPGPKREGGLGGGGRGKPLELQAHALTWLQNGPFS